eukprot:g35117.t1
MEEIKEVEGHLCIETKNNNSSLVLEGALREDEAKYEIVVQNPAGEDKAVIFIKVVGRSLRDGWCDVPDPPENVKIVGIGEDWCIVEWDVPKYDGGQPITGTGCSREGVVAVKMSDILVLEAVQRKFTRLIRGMGKFSHEENLSSLGLFRRMKGDLIET